MPGRGDKIEKVFMVQGGHSYSVTMDVLKIDSWFAGWDLVHVFCISVSEHWSRLLCMAY